MLRFIIHLQWYLPLHGLVEAVLFSVSPYFDIVAFEAFWSCYQVVLMALFCLFSVLFLVLARSCCSPTSSWRIACTFLNFSCLVLGAKIPSLSLFPSWNCRALFSSRLLVLILCASHSTGLCRECTHSILLCGCTCKILLTITLFSNTLDVCVCVFVFSTVTLGYWIIYFRR